MRSVRAAAVFFLLASAHVALCDDDEEADSAANEKEAKLDPDSAVTDEKDNENLYDDSKGAVVELVWDVWIETVVEEEEFPWLVNFYATWCGHCKKMKDMWIGLGQSLRGVLKIGAVNCANDKNKNLQTLYGSKGFPSIYFFPAGARKKPFYYPYGRDMNTLVDFALGSMPTLTAQVNDSSLEEYRTTHVAVPHVLLFTSNMVPPNVYNALANHYRMRLVFGQANNMTGVELMTRYKVTKFPQLVVLPFGKKKWRKYDGSMDYGPLREFLDSLALETAVSSSVDDFYKPFHIPPDFSVLPRIDPAAFNETIVKGERPSLVFLYHTWSYPSKFWIPNLESLYRSGTFADDLDMYYLNIDDDGGKDIYIRLGLNKIPALYYFPGNNKKGGSYTGENSEGDFAKFIEKRLQKTKNSKKKSSEEL